MNIRRALRAGIFTYLGSLVVGIIAAFIFNSGPGSTQIHPGLWAVGVLAPIIFAWVFSSWYFRAHVNQGRLQGLMLGITMIVIGIILDVILSIPSARSFTVMIDLLSTYYSQWAYWVTSALVILTCVLVGGNIRKDVATEQMPQQ